MLIIVAFNYRGEPAVWPTGHLPCCARNRRRLLWLWPLGRQGQKGTLSPLLPGIHRDALSQGQSGEILLWLPMCCIMGTFFCLLWALCWCWITRIIMPKDVTRCRAQYSLLLKFLIVQYFVLLKCFRDR